MEQDDPLGPSNELLATIERVVGEYAFQFENAGASSPVALNLEHRLS